MPIQSNSSGKAAGSPDQPLQIPEPFDTLLAGVMRKDRRRFEVLPGLQMFVRPYVCGELWPWKAPGIDRVQVVQIEPGVRIRIPLQWGQKPLTLEEVRQRPVGQFIRERGR